MSANRKTTTAAAVQTGLRNPADFLERREWAALAELKQTLVEGYGLVRLTLIGSKSRGDSDPESDIDVVIILKHLDSRIQFEIFDLCFDLSLKHDVLIQPILYSDVEARSSLVQATPFYQTVQSEGIPL